MKIRLAILVFSFACILIPVRPVQAAMLYTGSANQVVYMGDSFVVEWYLDTQGKEINSLDFTVTFSPEKLEVLDASSGNSFVDLWVKAPTFDNSAGTIRLTGGISGGVSDEKLNVFRATLKAKEIGSAKISVSKGSDVLLSDGLGTSAGLIFNEVNFNINPQESKPAKISSATHPDQDIWYKDNMVIMTLAAKQNEEYSYSFSSNLEIFPDDNADDVSGPLEFSGLPDGIYYLKLNSKLGPSNWQEAGIYRVKIDSTPPREFNPAISQAPGVFDGKPFVSFNTTDSGSGISHYEVKSNFFSGWEKTENSYFPLSGLVLGDKIEVKVVDEAGNERISQIKVDKMVSNSVFSNLVFWVIIALSCALLACLVWYYFKLLKKYKVNDK
jgi:hypothetical protein